MSPAALASSVGRVLRLKAVFDQPLLLAQDSSLQGQQYTADLFPGEAGAEEECAVFLFGLGAQLVPELGLHPAEAQTHVTDVQQLPQVHVQEREGLKSGDELLVVLGEAGGGVPLRYDAGRRAGHAGDILRAVLERPAPVAELGEFRADAQLCQQGRGGIQRGTEGVLSFRAEQAAPASQRRGGEGVELPVQYQFVYGLVQQFRRTGDQGFKQFFSGHCALPWFRLIHISCGGKSVLQRHKGTAQHPRLPLLEL